MSPRIKICKQKGCMSEQTTEGYCRLHYLKFWKQIRADKQKKQAKSLNRYIENMVRGTEAYQSKANVEVEALDFDGGQTPQYSRDEFDNLLEDLGYREDLDRLIDNIKVDKDF